MREMTTTLLFFGTSCKKVYWRLQGGGALRGNPGSATDDVIHSSPFNILIRHHFPEHIWDVQEWNTCVYTYAARLCSTSLPPANEVCEGNVFTDVYLSRGEVSAPLQARIHPQDQRQTPLPQDQRQTSPLGRHPHSCTAHAGIRSTSGRYASHWNAFLFSMQCTAWRRRRRA